MNLKHLTLLIFILGVNATKFAVCPLYMDQEQCNEWESGVLNGTITKNVTNINGVYIEGDKPNAKLMKRDETWNVGEYFALGQGAARLLYYAGSAVSVYSDARTCMKNLYNNIGDQDHLVQDYNSCSCGAHFPSWSNKENTLNNWWNNIWASCRASLGTSNNYVLSMGQQYGVDGGVVVDCSDTHYNGARAMVYDWIHQGPTREPFVCGGQVFLLSN